MMAKKVQPIFNELADWRLVFYVSTLEQAKDCKNPVQDERDYALRFLETLRKHGSYSIPGSEPRLHILVQVDRFFTLEGHEQLRRYYIAEGMDLEEETQGCPNTTDIIKNGRVEIVESDRCAPQRLAEFLSWCDQFPAQHTLLCFDGHGKGIFGLVIRWLSLMRSEDLVTVGVWNQNIDLLTELADEKLISKLTRVDGDRKSAIDGEQRFALTAMLEDVMDSREFAEAAIKDGMSISTAIAAASEQNRLIIPQINQVLCDGHHAIDIIIFDNCGMMNIENAVELTSTCHYMMGCKDPRFTSDFAYDLFIPWLRGACIARDFNPADRVEPSVAAEQLFLLDVLRKRPRGRSAIHPVSVVDLKKLKKFRRFLRKFVDATLNRNADQEFMGGFRRSLDRINEVSPDAQYSGLCDLNEFFDLFQREMVQQEKRADNARYRWEYAGELKILEQCIESLKGALTFNDAGERIRAYPYLPYSLMTMQRESPQFGVLSLLVYFPLMPMSDEQRQRQQQYSGLNLSFTQEMKWMDLLGLVWNQ